MRLFRLGAPAGRGASVDSRRPFSVGFRPYETIGCCCGLPLRMYFTAPFALAGLFESMSCGCSLVVAWMEPVREVVRHGETGSCGFTTFADMTAETVGPLGCQAR